MKLKHILKNFKNDSFKIQLFKSNLWKLDYLQSETQEIFLDISNEYNKLKTDLNKLLYTITEENSENVKKHTKALEAQYKKTLLIEQNFNEKYWSIIKDEALDIYIIKYSNLKLQNVSDLLDEKNKGNTIWKQKILFLLANYLNETNPNKQILYKEWIIEELNKLIYK